MGQGKHSNSYILTGVKDIAVTGQDKPGTLSPKRWWKISPWKQYIQASIIMYFNEATKHKSF